MGERSAPTPVIVLAGFLGSGKTTLLTRLLGHCKARGLRPAVIMNELGDVNLDGMLVERDVPMAEMLSGCICCSMRGDLGMEITTLVKMHDPDVIVIESTGAASPLEMIDGVTEAALTAHVSLESIVTVVDGPEFLRLGRRGKGRVYKLQRDGIVCATRIVLNKTDLLQPDERVEAEQLLRELNRHAPVAPAVRCEVDERWLDTLLASSGGNGAAPSVQENVCESGGGHAAGCGCDGYGHGGSTHEGERQSMEGSVRVHDGHDHSGDHMHNSLSHGGDGRNNHGHTHDHSGHDHVMAATCYLDGPVDSKAFEAFLRNLPDNVYRAKGIVTFTDTSSRFLFQYAYRETDFMAIRPQGEVHDVAVFIGEHFVRDEVLKPLAGLVAKS